MIPPARLHPADLEALADLIAERLASRPLSGPEGREESPDPGAGLGAPQAPRDTPGALLTAAQVAARFGVKAEWVRDHAAELGAIPLGTGPRPRLRFDAQRVADALAHRAPCDAHRGPAAPRPEGETGPNCPPATSARASGCPTASHSRP